MSDQRKDDELSSNPDEFVTLTRDTISDLQERFGVDMRIRSRRGPISRVIEAAAPKKPVTPPPAKPQRYGRDGDYDRDGNYDRDKYDRDDYDRDKYDRDKYDRDAPGYDRDKYDRDGNYDRDDYDRD